MGYTPHYPVYTGLVHTPLAHAAGGVMAAVGPAGGPYGLEGPRGPLELTLVLTLALGPFSPP